MTAENPRPDWIKDGVRVIWTPPDIHQGPKPEEIECEAIVNGEPWLEDYGWCVDLRDMRRLYGDTTRAWIGRKTTHVGSIRPVRPATDTRAETARPEAPSAPQNDSGERWGWGATRETESWQGSFRTRAEAIAEARSELGPEAEIWVLPGIRVPAEDQVPGFSSIADWMADSADECPDYIDAPFEYADGAERALDVLLSTWAKAYVTANWWEPVGEPERVAAEGEATL